jgi:serine/threonine protein kinase
MLRRYSISNFINNQPSGALFEGMDYEKHQKVLISRLFSEQIETNFEDWRHIFYSVIERAAKVDSGFILKTLAGEEDEDGPFIVQSYERVVSVLRAFPERMQLTEFGFFAKQSLMALRDLHALGLNHGAISPESFMVTLNFSKESSYKVADLFMADLIPHICGKNPENFVPTHPAMLPPEFFRGDKLTAQSDIYMLGQTFYYFLFGAHPFIDMDLEEIKMRHEQHLIYPLAEIIADFPTSLSDLVERMTSPDLAARPHNLDTLLSELEVLSRSWN